MNRMVNDGVPTAVATPYARPMPSDMKPRSHEVTDGFERAPARAMLRAIGMTDDDWDKPQVGVASSWNEVTPCNMPLDRLAKRAKDGVRDAGGFPIEFVTIAVSDGISMGHEGMRASLVSREVIADSVETVMHAERFDALVTFAGCDKSLPGMLMAAARLNLPSVFLYGGLDPARPGAAGRGPRHRQRVRGGRAPGRPATLTDEELAPDRAQRLPDRWAAAPACSPPTPWRRWPRRSAWPCPAARRPRPSTAGATTSPTTAAGRSSSLLELGIRPRQILTKEAFENAIAVVMALGGSTNAVLHLLAIANEARVELDLDDFNRVGRRVPHIADTKPHGRYHMVDLDRIGGVPVVHARAARRRAAARRLPDRDGQDHGREPGRPRPAGARRRRRPPARPTRSTPTAASPSSRARWPRRAAVVKVAGIDVDRFEGTARVFDGEDAAMEAILAGRDRAGHRGGHPLRGPQGRPGHAGDAGRHRRHEGRRPGRRLRPGHRRPVLRRDPRVLHRPRGARGGRRRARSPSSPTATGS